VEPLWTPWRMSYIQAIKSGGGCVFCDDVLHDGTDPDLVIHRGQHAFVVLNLYPYTTGHLMVVPYRHVASLAGLEAEEATEATRLLQQAERAVEAAFAVRQHHVGINLGRCAGAGVEGHLHIHRVPRATPHAGRPFEAPLVGAPKPLTETRDRLAAAWDLAAAHSATS
jgi:ATP adenylyltransferase